jgi:putative methyltransferase
VNTLLTTTDAIVSELSQLGYVQVDHAPENSVQWSWDSTVPGLIKFASSVGDALPLLPAVQSHKLILQDKSSCFSVLALNLNSPDEGLEVIDTCAAPGNKTSQLAALLRPRGGKVYAFERDSSRFQILQRRLSECGASNVYAFEQDFLSTDPLDVRWRNVRYMVVDPTCSGSSRNSGSSGSSRLKGLVGFQVRVLCHALKFVGLFGVVYSTCSLEECEDERVVQEVLSRNPDWRLERALPSWSRRGILLEECVRCDPREDETRAFFVASFVRRTA